MADLSHSSPTAAAAGDALLASSVASDASKAAAADLDREFGFLRPDFGKEKLAGTVDFHQRHVFLCYKGPKEWPSHVEATEFDRLRRLLADAIEARKEEIQKITKLNTCEAEDGTESSPGMLLVFPDMIRYRGLTQTDVDNFVEEVLVKEDKWLPGSPEAIKGSYVFVCAHGGTDKRCGVCGPVLVARFKEEIEGQGLDGQVSVSACSHVGGYKYAGNVIIFSANAKGEVSGHWYGYVAPDDVPVLLHKHIVQGEIVDHLWRGQLDFSEIQQKKALVCAHEQGKLSVPSHFNGDQSLHLSEVHGFHTAGQLKDAVNKANKWLTTKMAMGLLSNGPLFIVELKDISDVLFQVKGAVCLIPKEGLKGIKHTINLYTTTKQPLQEQKPIKTNKPIGEVYITRCDFGGNRWTVQRFFIEDNDIFQILQWRPRVPDDEFCLKKSVQSPKRITQHEEVPKIVNCIAMIEEMTELSTGDKARAIIIVKAEENQTILAGIKSKELRMSWLREEIKNQERIWERGERRSGP